LQVQSIRKESIPFLGSFDTFADDQNPEISRANQRHASGQAALPKRAVDATDERHVELHEVGLQL